MILRTSIMRLLFLFLGAVVWAPQLSSCDNLLAVLPMNAMSHNTVFEPIIAALAKRGHKITLISHFAPDPSVPNIKFINLTPPGEKNQIVFSPDSHYLPNPFSSFSIITTLAAEACEQTFKHPALKELLNSNQKFDLLISEAFCTDCFLGFAHRFKVPIVALSAHVLMPWAIERMGMPTDHSYVPNIMTGFGDDMTFTERFINTLTHMVSFNLYYRYNEYTVTHPMAREFFGPDMPNLEDLASNTSLILVNSHVSLHSPRPSVPGVVDIAGVHLKPVKPLPENIKKYLDGSSQGVVYFSMGSILQGSKMSNTTVASLLNAFSRLKQNVLWKWEGEKPAEVPSNVRLDPWLPQRDLLMHPNVKLFITHGGLGSYIEAVDAGVPLVVIPMFGDQYNNVAALKGRGMGLKLNYPELINSDYVHNTLKEVLDNPSFTAAAKRVSSAFRDRTQSPLDSAVWWTEYVLRHNGAPHLRTRANLLPYIIRYNLDVLLALLLAPALLVAAVFVFFRAMYMYITRSKKPSASKSKKRSKTE